MKIEMILASSQNGMIGHEGKLPWPFIKEDMAFFKKMTLGKHIVMGRKTYDSLGGPLPGRVHHVLTYDFDFKAPSPNVIVHRSVESVLVYALKNNVSLMIAGGLKLYNQFKYHADTVYLTIVEKDYDGDTEAPDLSIFTHREEIGEAMNMSEDVKLTFYKLAR
jgi:dihydrofolate reductase